MVLKLTVARETELSMVARKVKAHFSGERIFLLFGAMGVGKTTFVKAMAEAMGVKDIVSSPTFSLVNQYDAPGEGAIFHFDLYRINKVEELLDIGYEEYLYSGNYCFIEWPEKMEGLLPESYVSVVITEQEGGERCFEVQQISSLSNPFLDT
ncbi:MAG: tRNA (adenosine(37)-N6)-threonylcarbamoyltransferase complex ATPase subunit type 1 TsaE [Bacteroidetes bacterium]|nr:MAG: tRNA (adenosine(37)-N6)-threonylcarbamoyltransferase complex ATPase subunit type 1 TsaE [Bacteroidota bacterium]PIE87717.1 MAG: tRNA (adenosine(37)-N6)-threonylcarbamoyltransferase complex ATPase subunit type 1 TsaE [Bacteroidota bacterium]